MLSNSAKDIRKKNVSTFICINKVLLFINIKLYV